LTGEFNTQSDIITEALRYWFDNKNKPSQKEEFKKWLRDPEGEEFIKNIMRKVNNGL
jgi:Arc/MetJ-type ribon-helix-helix transcriptional regulator